MIVGVTNGLWAGDSSAEKSFSSARVAVLNVACDMASTRDCHDTAAVAHVGLIDGPGNEVEMYAAALYVLHTLMKKYDVLVCCHTGSRALAVCVMYLAITSDTSWDRIVELLNERMDKELFDMNEAHKHMLAQVRRKVKLD